MRFRFAFPAAALLGGTLGAIGVALIPETHETPSLVQDALAAPPLVVRWDLPVVRNAPVNRFVEMFSERQPDRMALYLKRSGRYEGMIREKLRQRGMPEDLLYLSMIESGFNPNARSSAQAVGLWQFIAGTARRYGLRVDGYVDERRDPEKSTDAALAYLSDLHGQFGSWYLAAAAYNTGEGRVSRAMRDVTGSESGTEQDFWRIRSRLPSETREYVPLMVAAALVGKEPHRYGLGNVERYLPVPLDTVLVAPETDLATVATAVGVSRAEIRKLNPHLIRGTTPPRERYAVRVPEGRAALYAAHAGRASAERSIAGNDRVAARERTHRVRSGESLWSIARNYDTTVSKLRRANGLGSRSRLQLGQELTIPA